MNACVNISNIPEQEEQFFVVQDSAGLEIRKKESELSPEEFTKFQNLVQLIKGTESTQFLIKEIVDDSPIFIDFCFYLHEFENDRFFTCELSELTEQQQNICNAFFNAFIN